MTPNIAERSRTLPGTPSGTAKATAALRAIRDGRIEDYAELRRQQISIEEAARRLRVSTRTIERYRAHLKKQGRDQ